VPTEKSSIEQLVLKKETLLGKKEFVPCTSIGWNFKELLCNKFTNSGAPEVELRFCQWLISI
jgi:hypothetical protein